MTYSVYYRAEGRIYLLWRGKDKAEAERNLAFWRRAGLDAWLEETEEEE